VPTTTKCKLLPIVKTGRNQIYHSDRESIELDAVPYIKDFDQRRIRVLYCSFFKFNKKATGTKKQKKALLDSKKMMAPKKIILGP